MARQHSRIRRQGPTRLGNPVLLIAALCVTLVYLGLPRPHDVEALPIRVQRDVNHRMCEKYPDDGSIAISIKTGATEAMTKLPAVLSTSLSCVKDVMIFSDLNQTFEGIPIYDTLADFSPEAMLDNRDFDIYKEQLIFQRQGRESEIGRVLANRTAIMRQNDWRTKGHSAAWALDKYKFLHMLEKAYELQPGRDWYLFVEPDTYVSWPNLNRWIRTLDPGEKLFLGNAVQKSQERAPLYFAHGGSGFILSGAAMKEFAVDNKGIAKRYEHRIQDWWAGDFTVADVLYDEMRLQVSNTAPMFTGYHPLDVPFWEGAWCEPSVTLHHMQAQDFEEIAYLEDSLDYSRLLLRDVYAAKYDSIFPAERLNWDNGADDKEHLLDSSTVPVKVGNTIEFMNPNSTFDSCRVACEYNRDCFQFMWRNMSEHAGLGIYEDYHSCALSRAFRLGGSKPAQEFWSNWRERDKYKAWHSGWLLERIGDWVEEHWNCPDGDHWVTDGSKYQVR